MIRLLTQIVMLIVIVAAIAWVGVWGLEKPGNAEATAPDAASVKVTLWLPFSKNHFTPNFSSSVRVTSAIDASIMIWVPATSRPRRMRAMR
jgi:hypothetical protein